MTRIACLTLLTAASLIIITACSDDTTPPTPDAGLDAAADGAADGALDSSGDASNPGKVVTCNNPALTPPVKGTCSVTKGTGSGLLLAGTVLAPDTVYENGRVLVVGTKITCVGCDCSASSGHKDATRIDCAKGVITPSLINLHDHLGFTETHPATYEPQYDHRHEWRKGKNGKPKIPQYANAATKSMRGVAWGELRQVLAGTTSILGVKSAGGLLRNLDTSDSEGLTGSANAPTFPLDDRDGIMKTQTCDYPSLPKAATVKAYKAYVPHVAEGISDAAHNEALCLNGGRSTGVDVTVSNATFIHAMGLTADDVIEMAQSGTGVNWSARCNISLYGMTADVVMLDHAGVKISLGTDWTATGSMNLLRELACAASLSKTYYDGVFSARDLWLMVTANAADGAGFGAELGRLKSGYVADIAIFDGTTRQHFEAITAGSVKDVALVLRGGEALYGDDAVLTVVGDAKCEALDVCGTARRICVEPEVGMTLTALEQLITTERTTKSMSPVKPYALFFCGTPTNEPSCVPARKGGYDGKITADDSDGDGVKDASDSCPKVFNPPRPMNGNLQPDEDKDKVGDECDPCPMDANSTTCSKADKDGDGVEDATDNCPNVKNGPKDAENQKDTDGDGLGDICDPCPTVKGTCPRLIKELRDPSLGKQPASKEAVLIEGAVVIGVRTTKANNYGFYARHGKAPFEAMFFFTKTLAPKDDGGAALKVGDKVDVSGQFDEYNNTVQLGFITSIKVTGSGDASPVAVKSKDLKPGSTSAEGHESQLVRLQNATTKGPVNATSNDFFWVSDDGDACTATTPACAQIGDFFYDGSVKDGKPAGAAGTLYKTIDGVINGYADNHTLDVRSDADLVK
jgi:hypothetical protein